MRRSIVILLGLVLVVAILAGIKGKEIGTLIGFGAQAAKSGPPPEIIGTAIARQDHWDSTLSAIGSVTAQRGVAVSNESPGVVTVIRFESGQLVHAGQVLVELDTSVERAQLASAGARRALAEVGEGRTRKLLGSEAVAKSQLDTDEATLKTSRADFSALQAQISRKIVRAPFAGRLGIRQVNLGQYLNPGTAVTVLESVGSVYVDFSLPQEQLPSIKVGRAVRISLTGSQGEPLAGVIAAIDPTVDSSTRQIKLRAGIANNSDVLRAGMFVDVRVELGDKMEVVTVPSTALVHASYGESVFIVEPRLGEDGKPTQTADGKPVHTARQQFVRVGTARGDFVAIADGVKAGQEIVSAGAFKLRNGGSVVVNNDVRPTPALAPHVENH